MDDIIAWFMVLSNAKIVSMLILMSTFIAIVIYVYGSKSRSKRFEEYRNIPFLDEDQDGIQHETSQLKGEK